MQAGVMILMRSQSFLHLSVPSGVANRSEQLSAQDLFWGIMTVIIGDKFSQFSCRASPGDKSVVKPSREAVVPEHFESLKAITAEIAGLARQQIKAAKDASFGGCGSVEAAAYEERSQRLAVLRSALAETAKMPADTLNMNSGLGNRSA